MNNYKVFEINVNENNSKVKNNLLDQARKEGYEFCFIKQNDLIIKNEEVYNKYCQLMDRFKLGVIFYPYYKTFNRLFNNMPNIAVRIKVDENNELQLVRFICKAFIGFNLKINDLKFDENLKVFEFDEYIKRLNDRKLILELGFFIDINNSWEYFDEIDNNKNLNINSNDIELDKKYLQDNKIELKMEYIIDNVIKKLINEYNL